MEQQVQVPNPIFNARTLLEKISWNLSGLSGIPDTVHEIKCKTNEGAIMLTTEERTQNASKRVAEAQHQQLVEQRRAREARKKIDQRRNYIIGELISKYFPEVKSFEPGTKEETAKRFQPLEAFLAELAADQALVKEIRKRARYTCQKA